MQISSHKIENVCDCYHRFNEFILCETIKNFFHAIKSVLSSTFRRAFSLYPTLLPRILSILSFSLSFSLCRLSTQFSLAKTLGNKIFLSNNYFPPWGIGIERKITQFSDLEILLYTFVVVVGALFLCWLVCLFVGKVQVFPLI